MVFTLGAESATTGWSLMALTQRVHSEGAITTGQIIFLLMSSSCKSVYTVYVGCYQNLF